MPRTQVESLPASIRKLGVTYRQVDYWCRRGYLRPIFAGGSGNRRHWTEAEIEIACRMVMLIRGGYMAGAAARLARHGVSDAQMEVQAG